MPNEARQAARLEFKHDPSLPISAYREEISNALSCHRVVIVAGDTGSGKSTQLPQYCLEHGRGREALIAHTQPRRLAARVLAARIAEELSQPVGITVGYRVRFADQVSAATRLVLLTDGLLLAELSADPLLRRYDTIIVDEAHERTLNIDLLLGALKRLLPRRPDLKLIVTSATLDVERMAKFFDDAPILKVSGRSHPIEVRYRDSMEEDPDLPASVLEAFREVEAAPGPLGRGDTLVFLPGEREIHDVGDHLQREIGSDVDILFLYSRLSWEQQRRIFEPAERRRIVLATNVAETSITVPGIRSVIDSGLARVSRYGARNRLQRLPIERVSRASADQRKGRCGRVGSGLCVRLYSQTDFEQRPLFTEPEVLRINLAALLLRLAADGLGAAESFPFIDAPETRSLSEGYRLLQELEALDADRRITRCGRSMARLPLDPRLARALLESKRFHAQRELLAIVAGLSVPDVRLASSSGGAVADLSQKHGGESERSEFMTLVKLWQGYRTASAGPRRAVRRWCQQRGLSALRLAEWEDVYEQVAERAAQLGIRAQKEAANYAAVHRSLLAGFCTMVGTRDADGAYLGTRGVTFNIFPGSPLRRRLPSWIMAASIVETSRVFARQVAEIEPSWVQAASRHLLKREYLEPDWDEAREQVVARERVSLLGLTLSANRWVNYGPIAPEDSRLIFAREALVHRRLRQRPDWLRANDATIDATSRMEDRLRTRDLLRPSEYFVTFYDTVLPRQVSSAATLAHFTRHLDTAQLAAVTLEPEQVFARIPNSAELEPFPERVGIFGGRGAEASLTVAVEYRFEPGEADDGAILKMPVLALPTLTRRTLDDAVPGFAEPRLQALLRSLPKEARRELIPIGATVREFLHTERVEAAESGQAVETGEAQRLARWLEIRRGMDRSLIRFGADAVPAQLQVQLAVVDGLTELARGRDLRSMRLRFAGRARAELDRLARSHHPGSWQRFQDSELPAWLDLRLEDGELRVHPTLVHAEGGVFVRYEWTEEEAAHCYDEGAVYLARAMLDRQARLQAKAIAAEAQFMLAASPYMRGKELIDLVLQLTFRRACFADAPAPRTRDSFEAAVERAPMRLTGSLDEIMQEAARWFATARAIRRLLEDQRARVQPELGAETDAHLRTLLSSRGLLRLSDERRRQLPRYFKAEERRWQRLVAKGIESPRVLRELREWSARADGLADRVAMELRWLPQIEELRRLIEEFRVSLYAQELGTDGVVSRESLDAQAAQLEAWLIR